MINYLSLHPAGILTGFSINFHQISGFYKQWHLNNSASFQGCCFCSRLGAIALTPGAVSVTFSWIFIGSSMLIIWPS